MTSVEPFYTAIVGNNILIKYKGNQTDVEIPVNITQIGDEAFAFSEKLTNIIMHEGITNIGSGAFRGCKNLENIKRV